MTRWAQSLVVGVFILVAAFAVTAWSHPPARPAGVEEQRHSGASPRSVDRELEQDGGNPSADHDWPWRAIPALAVVVLVAGIGSVRVGPVLLIVLRR